MVGAALVVVVVLDDDDDDAVDAVGLDCLVAAVVVRTVSNTVTMVMPCALVAASATMTILSGNLLYYGNVV